MLTDENSFLIAKHLWILKTGWFLKTDYLVGVQRLVSEKVYSSVAKKTENKNINILYCLVLPRNVCTVVLSTRPPQAGVKAC